MSKHKPFRFKQFQIYQEKAAMKIGTDGVLLGAWTPTKNAKSILDVGCGTALLSLMLAQKSDAIITGIDLDFETVQEAIENVHNSPWPSQVSIKQIDFRSFVEQQQHVKYDLIISNPPFYHSNKINTLREKARQNKSLPFSILFEGVAKLLSKTGTFSLIIPFEEEENILNLGLKQGLYVYEILRVKGNERSKIKRSLLRFTWQKQAIKEDLLTIEIERNVYTSDYQKLLADYLIIF